MSQNKVTYFPLHGRTEFIRMMFYHSNTDFVSEEIGLDEWPKVKPDTARFPLGSMPVVVINGMTMYQSKAAARGVAISLGYYSTDHETIWAIDSLLDYIQESNGKTKAFGLQGGLSDDKAMADWLEEYKKRGDLLEARFAGHGKKYVAGTDKMTLADFAVAGGYYTDLYNDSACWGKEAQAALQKQIDDNHPNLKRYLEVTLKTELAAYLQKRKEYPF